MSCKATYDYDSETGILEVTLYHRERIVGTYTLTDPKIVQIIREQISQLESNNE